VDLPKLLKIWSGRWGSNPRRPAWEDDCKLETKNIAFPASRSGDTEYPVFALCLRAVLNGAQTEHTKLKAPALLRAGYSSFMDVSHGSSDFSLGAVKDAVFSMPLGWVAPQAEMLPLPRI